MTTSPYKTPRTDIITMEDGGQSDAASATTYRALELLAEVAQENFTQAASGQALPDSAAPAQSLSIVHYPGVEDRTCAYCC